MTPQCGGMSGHPGWEQPETDENMSVILEILQKKKERYNVTIWQTQLLMTVILPWCFVLMVGWYTLPMYVILYQSLYKTNLMGRRQNYEMLQI